MNRTKKLSQLKLGTVHPRGWLLEQLKRNKEGIGGHLPELEPRMIGTPYTTRETEPYWGEERKAGWGAEISGNYWNGLIELAYTLDDEELKMKARKWVEEMLKNRKDDGYLGTYTDSDNIFDDFNGYGTSCGMKALLSYYSATGDKKIFDAVYDCMKWFTKNWSGDQKSRYAGVAIVAPMSDVYMENGDETLRKFGDEYYDFLERNDLFGRSVSALSSPWLHYNTNHGAGYITTLEHPLEAYLMNGDPEFLFAAENAWRKAKTKMVQKTGGITCETEYITPVGSNVETEYCSITDMNEALGKLLSVTKNPMYGDDIERVVYNAGEGARKKDEKAIAYLHSPNQIFATETSSVGDHRHQVYAPCVPTACCPVMAVRLLPEFLRNAIMTDENGALWFTLYMPLSFETDNLSMYTETEYPFREDIVYHITRSVSEETTCYFRIPEWCEGAQISLNGKTILENPNPGTFAEVLLPLKAGDEIKVHLPMKVKISHVDDSDRSGSRPMTIEYGPLLYALPVPEKWVETEGHPVTPLKEGWKWYNVKPVIPKSGLDVYDDMGARKHLISWNVALDENLTADKIRVERIENDDYPWESPKVKLFVPGYKAPYSYPPYPCRTFEPYGQKGYVYATEELTLELIPFGCTALRISYFPRGKRDEKFFEI